MTKFRAAALQLTSTSDRETNLASATEWIERAAAAGARLVATPENTPFLGRHVEKARSAEPLDGPTCAHFADLARRLGIHLLLGSFAERSDDAARCFNTSILFGPDGAHLAAYRKIHLFDVAIDDSLAFRESDSVKPGSEPVVAQLPWCDLGLSICYDLRFGELYHALVERGADVLAIPSAFTATTGRAHWDVLLRTRAIENQSWVIAPAQVGVHDDDGLRESYGHASIVDPWGIVIDQVESGVGMAIADIDLEHLADVRRKMPIASHRRL